VGLPSFILLFLQDRTSTYAGHWSAPLHPIIWIATTLALARFTRKPALLGVGLVLLVGGTALAYSLDSYFPGGREYEADHYYMTDLETDLRQAVDAVPPDASFVATRRVVPHLAARSDLYQFPFTFYSAPLRPDGQRQDYYILDLTDSPSRRAIEPSESDSILEKRPIFHVQRFGPSVLLLSKTRPEPAEPRTDTFGGAIQLLGLSWPRQSSRSVTPGAPLTVQLFWNTPRRPDAEPTRVLRLYGPNGQPIAEQVGRPLDDYLPLRSWDRSQVVAEQVTLWPEGQISPGTYRLVVSWLLPDGRPLPLDGSSVPELELARLENR
jgi:hypothetical protein